MSLPQRTFPCDTSSYMAIAGVRPIILRTLTLPEFIEDTVCKYYKVSLRDVRGRKRKREIVTPRHVICYLLRKYTDLSFKVIGERLGKKDHTTIIHALTVINNLMDTEDKFRKEIINIEGMIEQGGY